MSYESNSSLDRALELAKKRFGPTLHSPQQKLLSIFNVIRRAMQFSYESEDGGGSTAKRHLGSGPEIHLKLLIPRYTSYLAEIHMIYDVKIAAMLLDM